MSMHGVSSIDHFDSLPVDKWGIKVPDDSAAAKHSEIHAFLVPGLAFDPQCNRLGHGRGSVAFLFK
jgi:5-formyltetrahydrofolate cyclo-ligase